jgi:hypothetical protein
MQAYWDSQWLYFYWKNYFIFTVLVLMLVMVLLVVSVLMIRRRIVKIVAWRRKHF